MPLQLQRRWVSGEAEAKKENDAEGVPISEIQPTPQEEVENAIHEVNATAQGSTAETQASAAPTETAETAKPPQNEISSDNTEQAAVNNAVGSQSPVSQLTSDVEEEGTRYGNFARAPRAPAEPKPSIYVGNLFFDVTENDLQKEFSRFGEIKSIRLIKDVRGLSKG